ncbi:MAG: hypothetical protein ACQCN4_03560 [Candidatus Bathyarchaeia archaeon]
MSLLSEFSYYCYPAIITWRRLNPYRNGDLPYRDDGVGLQLRGHVCGPD